MTIQLPQTLVQAARFDHSLEEALRGFQEPLQQIHQLLGNANKYGLFKQDREPYLLIVSQQRDKSLSFPEYNVLLSVTSRSASRNQQVAEQFRMQTGIVFAVPVPDWLQKHFELCNYSFLTFEKDPKTARDFSKKSKDHHGIFLTDHFLTKK